MTRRSWLIVLPALLRACSLSSRVPFAWTKSAESILASVESVKESHGRAPTKPGPWRRDHSRVWRPDHDGFRNSFGAETQNLKNLIG
jgi:hypothetical protein